MGSNSMQQQTTREEKRSGWAGWLLRSFQRGEERRRLVLLEKIPLGPRQGLCLVEADGQRLLVATSADGGAAFFPLDQNRTMGRPSVVRPA